MTKEFNNLEEIQKYYDKKTNTYIFKEDNKYIDIVMINYDLEIESNSEAYNISAVDINAFDIDANNIDAFDINACNITYYAVCYAYHNIRCQSIKGRRENHKHFVLDGVLDVEKEI